MLVEINLDQLSEDYHNGMSIRELAIKYQTSRPTIRNRLKKIGIKILSSKERIKNDKEKHHSLSKRRYDKQN